MAFISRISRRQKIRENNGREYSIFSNNTLLLNKVSKNAKIKDAKIIS